MTGIGLATILIHCVGGSLILGFNTGFTALSSRAFGAKNKILYKQILRKGILNLGFMLLIVIAFGFCSYRIAKLAGQNEAISEYSYNTLVYQLPGLCCFYISDFLWGYLNSQNVFKPIIKILLSGLGIHCVLSYFISSRYGFIGIIACTNISLILVLMFTLYFVRK